MSHSCLDCPTVIRNRAVRCGLCAFRHRAVLKTNYYDRRKGGRQITRRGLSDSEFVAKCWEAWGKHDQLHAVELQADGIVRPREGPQSVGQNEDLETERTAMHRVCANRKGRPACSVLKTWRNARQ
jgi:hypothetical protein